MEPSENDESRQLLENVLLPVANEADARATVEALEPYDFAHLTAVHAVEKGGGIPDKTPVEQSGEVAAKPYAAVQKLFSGADKHTAYARDVVDAIFEVAAEVDASAIAYRSRGGNRLMEFLSGENSLKLVSTVDWPVIALPREELKH